MLILLNIVLAPVVLILLVSFARMLADATGPHNRIGPSNGPHSFFHL
jgi:hypothetical protein